MTPHQQQQILAQQMQHLLQPVKQISQDEFLPKSKKHPKLREREIEEEEHEG